MKCENCELRKNKKGGLKTHLAFAIEVEKI